MQGLRSKDHVNAGRAADDVFALLARDAAAHGDQHAGTRLLDFADAAEVGESLLLGLFTNGAGVDDDQVGLLKHVGAFIAHFGVEKVGDATAVVVVHLAAEAAQIEFLRLHGLDPGTMFRAAGPLFCLVRLNAARKIWWRITDSNRGHKDYDSSALTD